MQKVPSTNFNEILTLDVILLKFTSPLDFDIKIF